MLLKEREMPMELRMLRALQGRMVFSPRRERQLWNADSGQAGECGFDELGAWIDDCAVRLNDLVLVVDGKLCQIDALYICDGVIYLFEVKNWFGAFDLMDGEFMGLASCPLAQLKRARKMLEKLLQSMQVPVRIEARLVFFGDRIHLYGRRREDPILLSDQLVSYFEDLQRKTVGVLSTKDVRLGQRLAACHVADNPYRRVAEYSSPDVKTGVFCPKCRRRMTAANTKILCCCQCGLREFKREGLRRSIAELDVLFPPEKQRAKQIYHWCDGFISKRLIHQEIKE